MAKNDKDQSDWDRYAARVRRHGLNPGNPSVDEDDPLVLTVLAGQQRLDDKTKA